MIKARATSMYHLGADLFLTSLNTYSNAYLFV